MSGIGRGREIEVMKRGVRRLRRRTRKHIPTAIAVMRIPTARKTPATALVFAKNLRCVRGESGGRVHCWYHVPAAARAFVHVPYTSRVGDDVSDADALPIRLRRHADAREYRRLRERSVVLLVGHGDEDGRRKCRLWRLGDCTRGRRSRAVDVCLHNIRSKFRTFPSRRARNG